MIDKYGNFISWIPDILSSKEPIYITLANCIKKDILNGKLEGGFRMPPQRVLANYLDINHSTVTRAYKLCEEDGMLKGVVGKGTFVSIYAGLPQNVLSDMDNSDIIDLGMILPLYEVNEELEKHLRDIYNNLDYSSVLKYAPPEGFLHQRYIFAKWLLSYRLNCKAEQVLITSGIHNALSVVLAGMFKRGDRILVDEITYPGFISLAKLFGIELIPIPTGADGIDIEELKSACKRETPLGIYLIPECHNPTSATLSYEKRKEIARLVEEHKLLLIEDNPYGLLINKGIEPISNMVPDRSFFIAGTSKAISPALRVAVLAAPEEHLPVLTRALNNLTWSASTINSEIMTQLIATNKYGEIVDRKIKLLKERNTFIDSILADYQINSAEDSLLRFLTLPAGVSDKDIELYCLKRGVQVFSSKRFSVSINQGINAIRLSVSGPRSIDELKAGVQIIKETINNLAAGGHLIV